MKALPLSAGALPAVASTTVRRVRSVRGVAVAFWWVLSIGCFAGLWEAAWAVGWADPLLLPPPHIFLAHFSDQAQPSRRATSSAKCRRTALIWRC